MALNFPFCVFSQDSDLKTHAFIEALNHLGIHTAENPLSCFIQQEWHFFLYEKAHRSNWAATKGSLLGSQPPSGVGDSMPKIQADNEGLPSQWGTHAGGRQKRSFSTFLPTTQFCSEFCLSRKCTLWYFENVMRRSTQEKSNLPVPNVTSHLQIVVL